MLTTVRRLRNGGVSLPQAKKTLRNRDNGPPFCFIMPAFHCTHALSGSTLMHLTMRIPVVGLLEQRSGASSLRVTSEALSVFKHSIYCSKRLRWQDRRNTNATDPLCTARTPLCCICPWWDRALVGQGVNDPRRMVFPNIFAAANRRCAHIDVYSREKRVDFERRYCEGSPSNWLTFMRMLHRAQAHAEAAAPRDFFAIFLEDDAPPTPLWRKNLLAFFAGTSACGWDIARLSARVAGEFQGSAAVMVHSSYVGTLLRHMESEPIGSIDVWLTDLQRGSRVPRDKSLPAPLMAHSPLPVFTPVVGRFNSSFGERNKSSLMRDGFNALWPSSALSNVKNNVPRPR